MTLQTIPISKTPLILEGMNRTLAEFASENDNEVAEESKVDVRKIGTSFILPFDYASSSLELPKILPEYIRPPLRL